MYYKNEIKIVFNNIYYTISNCFLSLYIKLETKII